MVNKDGHSANVPLNRAESFKTMQSTSSNVIVDPEQLAEILYSLFGDELTRERCSDIAADIINKYRNHPKVLSNLLADHGVEKLKNLTKEFCPKPKRGQSLNKHWGEFRHYIRGMLDSKGFGEFWDILS